MPGHIPSEEEMTVHAFIERAALQRPGKYPVAIDLLGQLAQQVIEKIAEALAQAEQQLEGEEHVMISLRPYAAPITRAELEKFAVGEQ